MTDDVLERFLTATTKERLKMFNETSGLAPVLRTYLGDAAYDEYARLAKRARDGDLAADRAPNVIFVPGVMGSMLRSETLAGVWWVDVRMLKRIDDLRLSPDGTEDATKGYRVVPFGPDASYDPFLSVLLDHPTLACSVFAYDWRKSLAMSAEKMKDFIVKTYEDNGRQRVHLVAHSMGGLMVRTTLMLHGDELWSKVGRIVFIGTPHYGSPAIAGYLKNHLWGFELLAVLGVFLSRETFRSLWGVLSMMPAPRGIYPDTRAGDPNPWTGGEQGDPYVHPCMNFDPYVAESWKLGLADGEAKRLQDVLDGAAAHHGKLAAWHDGLDQTVRDRMLVIAGVGQKTLFRLAWAKALFGVWERAKKTTERGTSPHREGDGSVPLASAALENVAIRYVAGVHAGLPNMRGVYEDVFAWLGEKALKLPSTVEGALAEHLGETPARSEAPRLDGSALADADRWHDVSPEEVAALRGRVERGEVNEFTSVRLL